MLFRAFFSIRAFDFSIDQLILYEQRTQISRKYLSYLLRIPFHLQFSFAISCIYLFHFLFFFVFVVLFIYVFFCCFIFVFVFVLFVCCSLALLQLSHCTWLVFHQIFKQWKLNQQNLLLLLLLLLFLRLFRFQEVKQKLTQKTKNKEINFLSTFFFFIWKISTSMKKCCCL